MKFTIKGFCDTHTHTISSGHAYSTITEIAAHAASIGLSGVAMTDHAPLLQGATHPFHFSNLGRLPDEIHGVRILKGAEVNILNNDGEVDLDNLLLEKLELVIASLHLPTFDFVNIRNSTEALLATMENKNIDIIGHPDDGRIECNREELVKGAKRTNMLLEVNCSSLAPNSFRQNGRELTALTVKECKKQDVSIVIGSDAHYHSAVGDFSHAFSLLEELDFPLELVANRSLKSLYKFLDIKD